MEMNENKIVLKHNGSTLLSPFLLGVGEAIIVFVPSPQTREVRYVSTNKDQFYCYKKPYWVEFVGYSYNKYDLQLINANLMRFQEVGVFSNEKSTISQTDIDMLDGGDVRLLNLLLCRLKGEDFIELNVAGLSFNSIHRVLNYVLRDISKKDVAYIIVVYTDIVLSKTNPISLNNDTIDAVMDELIKENEVRLYLNNRMSE